MQKFTSRLTLVAAALTLAAAVPSANAAMVSFSLTNFGTAHVNYVVKLSDGTDSSTAGYLQVDVSIVPNATFPNTGDINGLFLGFADGVDPTAILALEPPQAAAGGAWFGTDVTEVFPGGNGGCNNINGNGGLPASLMDVGFTLGTCGSSVGLLTSSTVYFQGLSTSDIGAVGGRVQTVGSLPNGGGGSSKLYIGGPNNPIPGGEEIPEPATVTLMGAGLLGLMYFRRRRNS